MAKNLKVHERVVVKRGGRAPFKGTVTAIVEATPKGVYCGSTEPGVHVTEDGFNSNHDESPFHPKQCVRLVKKKKKGVRVTYEQLAKAWDEVVAAKTSLPFAGFSAVFVDFYNALGIKKDEA
jgi:hypothetical protein